VRALAFAAAALLGALLIGFLASQPPAAKPLDAPATQFSGKRAMADVRAIAGAPRPTGSAEIARVRTYLSSRMRSLGMAVGTQPFTLPERSARKLQDRGRLAVAPTQGVNLIGVLPGLDRAQPAVLLMAHYDSVWASPGAADDAAGVAAALEIVRAIGAEGRPRRDVVVLFTDAEEVGIVGADKFFNGHPLARRTGAVINMESRGGGGRTAMFETGRGNGEMIEVYRKEVSRPSSNSLAVLIYELMPNNTDFSIPKKQGIAGFNFAFIGEGQYYHSPASTAQALKAATLQDLGQQAHEVTRALAFAPILPAKSTDAVFGDILGLFVIAHQPILGWAVLAIAAGLFGIAWFRLRPAGREVAGGALLAVAFLAHLALLLTIANLLSGSGGKPNYYDRLAALPLLELQAVLLCLAALLLAAVAARPSRRLAAAMPALALTMAGVLMAGLSPVLLGIGLTAALLALVVPAKPVGLWSGWFGFAVPILLLALAAQIFAPTATPFLAWPLLLGSVGMAVAAAVDSEVKRLPVLALLTVLAAVGGGQLVYLGHLTFLGIGAPFPQVTALYALLFGLLAWPLVSAGSRGYRAAAAILILAAAGTALSVRLDPMAPTVPAYSLKSAP
jgi:hypothetical protein